MDIRLYYVWFGTALLFFLYAAGQRDWRGSFFGISAVLFIGLALASWNIETTYVFFNETSGQVVTYTISDYSIVNSFFTLGMGLISIALMIYKVFVSGLAEVEE